MSFSSSYRLSSHDYSGETPPRVPPNLRSSYPMYGTQSGAYIDPHQSRPQRYSHSRMYFEQTPQNHDHIPPVQEDYVPQPPRRASTRSSGQPHIPQQTSTHASRQPHIPQPMNIRTRGPQRSHSQNRFVPPPVYPRRQENEIPDRQNFSQDNLNSAPSLHSRRHSHHDEPTLRSAMRNNPPANIREPGNHHNPFDIAAKVNCDHMGPKHSIRLVLNRQTDPPSTSLQPIVSAYRKARDHLSTESSLNDSYLRITTLGGLSERSFRLATNTVLAKLAPVLFTSLAVKICVDGQSGIPVTHLRTSHEQLFLQWNGPFDFYWSIIKTEPDWSHITSMNLLFAPGLSLYECFKVLTDTKVPSLNDLILGSLTSTDSHVPMGQVQEVSHLETVELHSSVQIAALFESLSFPRLKELTLVIQQHAYDGSGAGDVVLQGLAPVLASSVSGCFEEFTIRCPGASVSIQSNLAHKAREFDQFAHIRVTVQA